MAQEPLTIIWTSANMTRMLKIRLQRVGKKNEPTFRIVLTDSKNSTKSGRFLEVLGSYDARQKNEKRIDKERVKHWIARGAKLTDTLHNLFISEGIIEGKKINVLPKKSPVKKEGEENDASEVKAEPVAEAKPESAPEAKVEPAPAPSPEPAPAPSPEPAPAPSPEPAPEPAPAPEPSPEAKPEETPETKPEPETAKEEKLAN